MEGVSDTRWKGAEADGETYEQFSPVMTGKVAVEIWRERSRGRQAHPTRGARKDATPGRRSSLKNYGSAESPSVPLLRA